jgi:tetratricopeptide (TPR) repeat protein
MIKDLLGDKKGAQKVLETALRYSPRAIRRQSFLSKLATENEDWQTALNASRKGIELGRYSCFKSIENYIHLTAALQPQLRSELLSDRRFASSEIFKTMDIFKKDFMDDSNALVAAHFIEGSTNKQMGQYKEAEKFIQIATELINSKPLEFDDFALNTLSKRLTLTCDSDTLSNFINSQACKNLSLQTKNFIEQQSLEQVKKATQEHIDQCNNKGVEFFEKGALAEAIQMFEKATEDATANFSVLLNAMQAHIAFLEKNGKNQQSISACTNLIGRLNEMPPTDRRQARKKRLDSIFSNLKSEW